MTDTRIERRITSGVVTIANGAALSDVIDFRQHAGGVLSMPAGWTAAKIAFKHSPNANGTFQPLYDESGSRVEVSVAASGDYAIPDKVFGCAFIKLWSETNGGDTNQGADRPISFTLKS